MRTIIKWVGAIVWQLLFWGAIFTIAVSTSSCDPTREDIVNPKNTESVLDAKVPLLYKSFTFYDAWDSNHLRLTGNAIPLKVTIQGHDMQIVFGTTGEVISGTIKYLEYAPDPEYISKYTLEWTSVNSKTKRKVIYRVGYEYTPFGKVALLLGENGSTKLLTGEW